MDRSLIEFLAKHPPFSFLPEAKLTEIAPLFQMIEYDAGTILFEQGKSRVSELFLLYSGGLELYYQEDGKRILNDLLSDGDTFGGISFLMNDGVAVRTVAVTEASRFYTLPKKTFLQLCKNYPEFSDYFTDTFGKLMLDKSYAALVASVASKKISGSSDIFLHRSLDSLIDKEILVCEGKTSVREAARLMSEKRHSAILIGNAGEMPEGIVTDKDFRDRVVATGLSIDEPVSEIMSSPLITINASESLLSALMTMVHHNIKHLAIHDNTGEINGILSDKRLLTARGQSPVSLLRDIEDASTVAALLPRQKQIVPLAGTLIEGGARAEEVGRIISAVADAVLQRLIRFALAEMGPPPARFAFLIMGSEGRREQTLKTDQDNAIIYEDVPESSEAAVHEYFLAFATRVCGWLNDAGYDYCGGDIMAQNPRWCQPLSQWKNYFRQWIQTPESQAVMHATIFFDFAAAYGDQALADELRGYLQRLIEKRSDLFFRYLAQNALDIKPPLGFFRNFLVEARGAHRNEFDIKKAMTPVVDFARIYALENGITATNTLERLHLLAAQSVLTESEHHELTQAYRYLMQIRLVRQINMIREENLPPDNYINPQNLSRIEQKMLKEIFRLVTSYQEKLTVHFLGVG